MGSSAKTRPGESSKPRMDPQPPLDVPQNSMSRNSSSSTRPLLQEPTPQPSDQDDEEPQQQLLPSQAPKSRGQKNKNKLHQAIKADTLNPMKIKEQLIDLYLDIMRLRTRVVYTQGQADATSLWGFSDDLHPSTGFRLCDGFEHTWFVSTDTSLPVPPSQDVFASDIHKRTVELSAIYAKDENKELFNTVTALLEKEVIETCQDEWDCNKNNPFVPPTEWEQVAKDYDGLHLSQMIAKTRLKTGDALLLDHYQIRVIEITKDGCFASQRVVFPPGLDLAAFCQRLDALFPPDNDHDRQVIDIVRNKLRIAEKYGSDLGIQKAQPLLKKLEKPFFQAGDEHSEINVWTYRLFAKDTYQLPQGKKPDRRGWTKLSDDTAFRDMEQGRIAGKYPVVVRVRPC